MDEGDIGNLREETLVCSPCSGSSVGFSVGKEEICDIGKGEGMLVGKGGDL